MKNQKPMIYFLNSQELLPVTYAQKILVRRAVEATLEYENVTPALEISVTFTDNEGIRKINKEFRSKDEPTDVLSFPLLDCNDISFCAASESLGDIVISLECAKEQADRYGHSFEREIAFLTVHSMLHLLGYDHVNSEEEELEMRKKQSEILSLMGLEIKQ